MHAHSIVDPSTPATDTSGSFRVAAEAQNDNASPANERVSLPDGLVARGPSRRTWLAGAAVALSLLAAAVAWGRPHPAAPELVGPAPVTPVDVAALAIPVASPPPAEPAALVIAAPATELPRRRHRRVRAHHAHHAHARHAHTEAVAAAPEADAPEGAHALAEAPQEAAEADEALPSDSADAVVERAVSEHTEAVDQCIDQAGDEAEGRITVDLVIAPSGAVRSATPHAPASLRAVGQCLAHAMSGWSMAVPDASGDTRIEWPFEVESNL